MQAQVIHATVAAVLISDCPLKHAGDIRNDFHQSNLNLKKAQLSMA